MYIEPILSVEDSSSIFMSRVFIMHVNFNRVLQLMNLTDSRLASGGCEKLEMAMLSFFEQFRKIYIGDQVPKNSKVYRRLSDVLGLADEALVLSVFIRKM